jgi:hypothetical protein
LRANAWSIDCYAIIFILLKMNFHQQKFNDLNFLEIHYVPSTDWLSEGMNELPHIVWNSISVVVAVLSSYSSILIKYEDMSRVEETCLIVSLLGWSFWYNFLLLFSLSTQSFVDLQFPNGQLTYVWGPSTSSGSISRRNEIQLFLQGEIANL